MNEDILKIIKEGAGLSNEYIIANGGVEGAPIRIPKIDDIFTLNEKGDKYIFSDEKWRKYLESDTQFFYEPEELIFYCWNGYYYQELTEGRMITVINDILPRGQRTLAILKKAVEFIKMSRTMLNFNEFSSGINFLNGFMVSTNPQKNKFEFVPKEEQHQMCFSPRSMLPFDYDPDAKCPVWDDMLDRMFKNFADPAGTKIAMQMFLGSMLDTTARIRCAMIMQGTGKNGKGVITGIMDDMTGGYSKTTSFAELDSRFGMTDFDKYKLIIIPEGGSEDKLPDRNFKSIVSHDKIAVEAKGGKYFSMRPTCKLLISVNWLPKLVSPEEAVRERMFLLKLTEQFKGSDMDVNLSKKLEKEYPGLFNYLMVGCQMAREADYKIPRTLQMEHDLNTWFDRDDSVATYLATDRWKRSKFIVAMRGDSNGDYKFLMNELHNDYLQYCEDSPSTGRGKSTRFADHLIMYMGCGEYKKKGSHNKPEITNIVEFLKKENVVRLNCDLFLPGDDISGLVQS